MKISFCTCVQLGLSCMEAIYEVNGKLDLILTLPDEKAKKKSGRVYVDDFARKNNIPVIKINHINDDEAINAIKDLEIDWLFIVGWSQIASVNVLNAPKYGVIGAHPTLLPEGRGRAAIPWAIIKGLEKSGVTFFKMNEGVDTGTILAQMEIPIDPNETATTLYQKVDKTHEAIIKNLYSDLVSGKIVEKIQDESKATYWEGRTPKDGELFLNMKVNNVDRLVRATTHPYPGAFIYVNNKKMIIWSGMIGENSNSKFVFDFDDGKYSVIDYQFET